MNIDEWLQHLAAIRGMVARLKPQVTTELQQSPVLQENLSEFLTSCEQLDATGEELRRQYKELEVLREQANAERRRYATLQHLHAISQALLAPRSPTEIADMILSRVQALIPCQQAGIVIFATESGTAIVRSTGGSPQQQSVTRLPLVALRPLVDLRYGQYHLREDVPAPGEHSAADLHVLPAEMRATLSVPLVFQEKTVGILIFGSTTPNTFTPEHVSIAQEIADHLAVAIQHALLFEQVQVAHTRLHALARRLLEDQEAERRAIARELHDDIGQILAGLKLTLGMARRSLSEEQRAYFEHAMTILDDCMARVSELSHRLRPSVLDNLGMLPALLWHLDRYTAQTGIRVDFRHEGLDRRFASEIETLIYRVVQEGLTNIARYANTDTVALQVLVERHTLTIKIQDAGDGFDLNSALNSGASGGLPNMRERVALVGGSLTIDTAPGKGTTIIVEVPLDEAGTPSSVS